MIRRFVLPFLALILVPLCSHGSSAAIQAGTLQGKEKLLLEGLEKATRKRPADIEVRPESFQLFRDPEVRGAIDPTAKRRDRWQVDFEGEQALEQYIAQWIRADGTGLPEGTMDEAEVEIEGLSLRGKRNRKGTKAKLTLIAQIAVSGPEGASYRGTYHFKGRARLAPKSAIAGDLTEEGYIPGPDGAVLARYRVRGDVVLVADDMRIPLEELESFQARVELGLETIAGEAPTVFQAAARLDRRWPDGRVPYVIAGGFSEDQLRDIRSAIRHWNSQTDVEVVERTNEMTFVSITPGDDGCWANVGYIANATREISLAENCGFGAIVHEIGHSVGLWHEQARTDRDNFVTIDIDNVIEDKRDNFDIMGTPIGPYNYRSIMHYSRYAFAIDDSSPTITPVRDLPVSETIIGQKLGLSKGDIAAANYLVSGDARIRFNAYSDIWNEDFAPNAHARGLGLVNDDDNADLIAFHSNGDVRVATTRRNDRFQDRGIWLSGFCPSPNHCLVGDVNGDGLADVVEVETGRVGIGTGVGFALTSGAQNPGIGGFDEYRLIDMNGDCRDDIVAVIAENQSFAETYVALSVGNSFAGKVWSGDFEGVQRYDIGDVDADGRADFVGVRGNDVFVYRSEGDHFGEGASWWTPASWLPVEFRLADVNGDRRADLIHQSAFPVEHAERVKIALSNGYAFRGDVPNYHEYDCLNTSGCEYADTNRDGMIDVVDAVGPTNEIGTIRPAGHVFVATSSRRGFITDPIDPIKPTGVFSVCSVSIGPGELGGANGIDGF